MSYKQRNAPKQQPQCCFPLSRIQPPSLSPPNPTRKRCPPPSAPKPHISSDFIKHFSLLFICLPLSARIHARSRLEGRMSRERERGRISCLSDHITSNGVHKLNIHRSRARREGFACARMVFKNTHLYRENTFEESENYDHALGTRCFQILRGM